MISRLLRPSLVVAIAACALLAALVVPAGEAAVTPGVSGVPSAIAPYGPTSAAPSGGEVGDTLPGSNRWKYRGTLGAIGVDEVLVDPVAAPPTGPAPGTAPLTGLPDGNQADRAMVVKIDNVSPARPQVSLNRADIVYEELVEAGLTRLAAVFHSSEPSSIGPVRSARSTDIGIAASFNEPVFANSGSNSIFDGLIADAPLVNRGAEQYGSGYWRSNARPAPHNLFTSAANLQAGLSPSVPAPHFAYRSAGEDIAPDVPTAKAIRLRYSEGLGVSIRYEWDADVDGWRRWQAGTAHVDSGGTQVAPANVVVQVVEYADAGLTDKWGEILYEAQMVGTGTALVFTDGHVYAATWTKPTLGSVTTFTDPNGNHIELTPGRTWVSLVPPGGVTFDSEECDGWIATVAGDSGSDKLTGTSFDDVIAGGGGSDLIIGNGGADRICGNSGHDQIFAGSGADRVFGGSGDDDLRGGDGNDRIEGGSGHDQLHGERGADHMRGGTGADQFFARVDEDNIAPSGSDVVMRGRS